MQRQPGRLRTFARAALLPWLLAGAGSIADTPPLPPVSDAELRNPRPADWLHYSRSYDNHRYSPLDQVNRDNVDGLALAWSHQLHPGSQENIPLVHRGVMFVANPRGILQALDAATGELHWEYRRELPDDIDDYIRAVGRARLLARYGHLVYYASPDGYLLALDAETGKLTWETRVHDYLTRTQHTTGPIAVNGKIITGRNCGDTRRYCFIAAHDAESGRELWKFFVPAAPGEAGGDTWGDLAVDKRLASPWGLPGGYDVERNLLYWGTANPNPHTRIKRHDGDPFAVPLETPSELYSNSTLALDPDSGEVAWYFQHLPGDDWDSDYTHERILFRAELRPDPAHVRWINPAIEAGEVRDMLVAIGEPGGIWVLDRASGEFLWATPFPADTPDFHIHDIDTRTGKVRISRDKVLTAEGQQHTTCFQNARSYWPMAYDAARQSLYVAYHDACVTRTGRLALPNGHARTTHRRAGSDPERFAGIASINLSTGRARHLHWQKTPGNGAVLLTAGGLVFWGDMSGAFYALDADAGEVLWDARVTGIIQTSTITYAVNGRQYIAIMTGDGQSGTSGPLAVAGDEGVTRRHNALYVFALNETGN